jgi:preprotein translocase subunit SecF
VVFDRIRENLKLKQKEDVQAVMNSSINEVLSRTIITSATVLFTSLALFLFGGEVIHDFSLAMIMGVVVGTYSSIFVASPIVLLWGGKRPFAKK